MKTKRKQGAQSGAMNSRWVGGRQPVACPQCGDIRMLYPSERAQRKTDLCGRCGTGHPGATNSRFSGGLHPSPCAQCGKLRPLTASQIRKGKRRLCSDCETRSREGKPKKGKVAWSCERCGTERLVYPYLAKQRHCSRCKGKRGSEHPMWRGGVTPERQAWLNHGGGKEFNAICRKRDGYACRVCGRVFPKSSSGLEVHHILSWALYPALRNEPDNGVCLCFECHHGDGTGTKGIHSKAWTELREKWERAAAVRFGVDLSGEVAA